MHTLTLCLLTLALAQPADVAAPLPLATLTQARAEQLDGQPILITLAVGKPVYTWGEGVNLRTVVGLADQPDSVERTVMLKGDRLRDVDVGTKLRVSGTLRVIRHPPVVVGGVLVEAWVEVRVEKG